MRIYPDWFLLRRYKKIGTIYGDMRSYCYMGEPIGYQRIKNKLLKLENECKRRGYTLVHRDTWVEAGGYGRDVDHLIGRKDDI